MNIYSIVFLDIDGTLLNSQHQVTPRTCYYLIHLQEEGIPVVLCSARPPKGVDKVALQIGLKGSKACYNGGLIYDEDRRILRDVGIDIPVATDFKQFISERFPDLVVSIYQYNTWLAEDDQHPLIVQEAEISGCIPLKGNMEKAKATAPRIHKLLCMGDPIYISALQNEVNQHFPKLMALRSKSTYLEILPKGSTKGSAAQVLTDYYGLSAEQAVAFGDNDVDVDMLKYCGLGVAMGNSPEQVKEAADYVTASNDEEGVYIALNTLRFKIPDDSRK